MVLDNVDVKTAQTRLGHSDLRPTLAIYAQATAEGDEQAADKLGERFMRPTLNVAGTPRANAGTTTLDAADTAAAPTLSRASMSREGGVIAQDIPDGCLKTWRTPSTVVGLGGV